MVALTFDDGPDPATTPALLAALERNGATATFFLIGERCERHPELVAAIAAAGHELGNHLLRDEPSVLLGRAEFERQLRRVHDLLTPHGPVRFFRPGSGWFTPRMLRTAAALGYRCALGTPGLVAARYPPGLAHRFARRARPGSILVLHEGTPARTPVTTLTSTLLPALTTHGLTAASLRDVVHDSP